LTEGRPMKRWWSADASKRRCFLADAPELVLTQLI